MKENKLSGFHCIFCERDILDKIKKKLDTEEIVYDEEKNLLKYPKEYEDDIKLILASEKIFFKEADMDDHCCQSHDHGHDGHHHHHHHHHHDHHHDHGHHDHHKGSRNIGIVFALNLAFSIIEFIFGSIFNSIAISTDAVHDLGDALSVGLAWIFERKSLGHADNKYTFGTRRYSLLGALITSLILIIGSTFMLFEAVPRLIRPEPVTYEGMFWLAIIAIIVNFIAARLLAGGRSKNEKSLNLHMLEDLLGWILVLAVSVILKFKPWYILDPILSLALSVFILYNAIPLFLSTIQIFLEVVPEGVDFEEMKEKLKEVDGVNAMTHLHLWTVDGEENNFAATVFTDKKEVEDHERIKKDINTIISDYSISCSTIEVVYDPKKLVE